MLKDAIEVINTRKQKEKDIYIGASPTITKMLPQ